MCGFVLKYIVTPAWPVLVPSTKIFQKGLDMPNGLCKTVAAINAKGALYMKYIVWKKPQDCDGIFYLIGAGVWADRPDNAKRYTLHGARSILGRMQRQWGVELKQPKKWGFYIVGSAS